MVQLSHLDCASSRWWSKKSAAGSCGITCQHGLGFIQLSNRDWLKHGSMESNILPIRFVFINYGWSIWMFLNIFQHSCDACIPHGEEVNMYHNCDRGGVYRNGEERKESYFLSYLICYPFSLLGACDYWMFCLWYGKPHLLWLDIK